MVTQLPEKFKPREELADFIFHLLFDSNRADKLKAIYIAKRILRKTEGQIGKKMGISREAVSQYLTEYEKNNS